jgi:thiopeptide-type bacteriocin biosynthesis protein
MIAVRLPDLLNAWNEDISWWFTRPGQPEHLRLWLAGSFPDVASKVCGWAQQLRQRGLLGEVRWDTDYPHPARTCPGTTATAAENVFTADSGTAVALLVSAGSAGPGEQAITVASIVDLAISFTSSTTAGLTWVTEKLVPEGQAPRPARPLRDEVVKLACPAGDFAALAGQPATAAVRTAWQRRRPAVARYAAQLRAGDSRSPDDALLSLVREHHQRVTGPGQDSWQITARLARSAAMAALAQDPGPP